MVDDAQDGVDAMDAGGGDNGWVETIEDDSGKGKGKGKKGKNKDDDNDADDPLGDMDNDATSEHDEHGGNDEGNIPEGGL